MSGVNGVTPGSSQAQPAADSTGGTSSTDSAFDQMFTSILQTVATQAMQDSQDLVNDD